MRHRQQFEVAGVGHRGVGAGHAFDRGIELVERLLIDAHRDLRRGAKRLPLFLDDHGVMRAGDRLGEQRHIQRTERPQVDHLSLDAVARQLFRGGQGDVIRFGEVELEVSDTGRGIPEDERQHLFEPFFSTKAGGRGTGLGLFVSAQIVHEHKGRIEVTSVEGQGASFRLVLPATEIAA